MSKTANRPQEPWSNNWARQQCGFMEPSRIALAPIVKIVDADDPLIGEVIPDDIPLAKCRCYTNCLYANALYRTERLPTDLRVAITSTYAYVPTRVTTKRGDSTWQIFKYRLPKAMRDNVKLFDKKELTKIALGNFTLAPLPAYQRAERKAETKRIYRERIRAGLHTPAQGSKRNQDQWIRSLSNSPGVCQIAA